VKAAGPHVFLGYTQAELDASYDQAVFAPNRGIVMLRTSAAAEAARRRLPEPLLVAYGSHEAERIEIFRTDRVPAPIVAFIHGGGWKSNSIRRFAFVAEPIVAAGAHCALIEFSGVETVDGRLNIVAGQVRRAVEWLSDNSATIGGDARQLYLTGHSSGAHLAATVIAAGDPLSRSIRGALLCSGMYELTPVALSRRSSYVCFDEHTIATLSPIRKIDRIESSVIVAFGTEETPEFQRQGSDFAQALRERGHDARLIVAEGYNHFEIAETFGNSFGVIGAAIVALVTRR
jgi:arylformamidase